MGTVGHATSTKAIFSLSKVAWFSLAEVAKVTASSPASNAGLQPGDFLVKYDDELVLFMSAQDIETKLKQNSPGLSLNLEIERGQVEPMVAVDHDFQEPTKANQEDVFTIVLDKNKGIYHIWKNLLYLM